MGIAAPAAAMCEASEPGKEQVPPSLARPPAALWGQMDRTSPALCGLFSTNEVSDENFFFLTRCDNEIFVVFKSAVYAADYSIKIKG